MRDKIAIYKTPVPLTEAKNTPSLLNVMLQHSYDPKGSPFLSTSNISTASTFGSTRIAAMEIDSRRLLPNAMAWSFLGEREVLVPLVVFPDEIVHFQGKLKVNDPHQYVDRNEFIKTVETKLGRALTPEELGIGSYSEEAFKTDGFKRVKELMLDPAKLPASVCTVEGANPEAVFQTLNALLK